MQKILLTWLFPAIFAGVSFFLILFLVQVNQSDASIYVDEADIPQAPNLPSILSKDKWIERFVAQEDTGFYYPVTEIFVEVDLKNPLKKTIVYQLITGDLDPYQMFCLKEVLKHYQIQYMFEQKKEELKLIIYSKNSSELKNIVKTLKNYAINASILKITKYK